jgi:hypothetical protein
MRFPRGASGYLTKYNKEDQICKFQRWGDDETPFTIRITTSNTAVLSQAQENLGPAYLVQKTAEMLPRVYTSSDNRAGTLTYSKTPLGTIDELTPHQSRLIKELNVSTTKKKEWINSLLDVDGVTVQRDQDAPSPEPSLQVESDDFYPTYNLLDGTRGADQRDHGPRGRG